MAEDTNQKYVTFRVGNEVYGIDIMLVHSIVDYEDVRSIPNAPVYVEGLYNLRGEVIPIINLHRRFQIPVSDVIDKDAVDGIIIIDVNGCKVGLVVDSVLKIISIETGEIQQSSAAQDKIGNAFILRPDCLHHFRGACRGSEHEYPCGYDFRHGGQGG